MKYILFLLTAASIGYAQSKPDTTLPVELYYFTVSQESYNVILEWGTQTEVNNYGFYIERRYYDSLWTEIGFEFGAGNSNIPIDYTFIDSTLVKSGLYYYRLRQIDVTGGEEYSDSVHINYYVIPAVNDDLFNKTFVLKQNYPNPFNPVTTIEYEIKTAAFVRLTIFNSIGEQIAVPVNERKIAGSYKIKFNAGTLPSGIYFYKLNAGNYSETRKLILIK